MVCFCSVYTFLSQFYSLEYILKSNERNYAQNSKLKRRRLFRDYKTSPYSEKKEIEYMRLQKNTRWAAVRA